MMQTFATPKYHIIYDAACRCIWDQSHTGIFHNRHRFQTGASETHISVAGVGYDRNSGGTEFDKRMREIIIGAFNEKSKKDVREDKRGMVNLKLRGSRQSC